jgi:hypothetical protein
MCVIHTHTHTHITYTYTHTHTHTGCKVMVFLLTCAHVDYYARLLPKLPALQALRCAKETYSGAKEALN